MVNKNRAATFNKVATFRSTRGIIRFCDSCPVVTKKLNVKYMKWNHPLFTFIVSGMLEWNHPFHRNDMKKCLFLLTEWNRLFIMVSIPFNSTKHIF